VGWCTGDKLDQDIFDAVTNLLGRLVRRAEQLAGQFGVPVFCVKAMHRMDSSMTLKELGRRMQCDPSFVTMIADALEQRGLARREPHPDDRRIKNLVLTEQGHELKAQVEAVLLTEMPWARTLDRGERETLLRLLRKMADAMPGPCGPQRGSEQHRKGGQQPLTAAPA
jgi:DNA-binding MarR family transcriptional regulator